MNFNTKQSLTYFFKDRTWASKATALFLLSLLMIAPIIGPFIFLVLAFGYLFFVSNSRILKTQNNLPKFDMKVSFITGIKFCGFSILCGLIFSILNIVFGLIPYGFIFIVLITLIELFVLDLAVIVYSTNLNFHSLFNIETYKKILTTHLNNYIEISIIKCVISIPVIILSMVVCLLSMTFFANHFLDASTLALPEYLKLNLNPVHIIESSLILDILFIYTAIVIADLNTQFIRQMNGIKEQNTEENALSAVKEI